MNKRNEPAYVLERMRALCSRREYCVADIMKKASKALGGDMAEAERIVESLVADKYLDDRRYASAYARDKASISGWGPAKIRYMLAGKGVSREIIAEAMEDIDSAKAGARLDRLMETRFKALKGDPQCRMKLLRFAMARGYSYDDVLPVIDRLIGR